MSKTKQIRDPIYGFIPVDEFDLGLIDHKLIQRLRWVSQLPLEQLVYPSAQHSRFEHSLGVMHLAGIAAESLVRNSRIRFKEAAEFHEDLRDLKFAKQKGIFVRCARWAGLLHDIGHAPFSHTLEDACKYCGHSGIFYNHEFYGSFLARRVFEDLKEQQKTIIRIVQRVLNKKIPLEELYPPEMLLRRIIDGPMDVDKGDYLPRDSYHCGVSYGVYDHQFLWKNVVITKRFQMGVKAKAALEAWALVLARHRMFNYVYKHHVRNITDALLVEILHASFQKLAGTVNLRDILPLWGYADVKKDEYIHKFVHWTDNSLLKALDVLGDADISGGIEAFANRKIYKRAFSIKMNAYADAVGNEAEVLQKVNELKKEMALQGINWNAIPVSETLTPVFSRDVQQDLLVQLDTGRDIPLAECLDFAIEDDRVVEKGDTYLHVFTDPFSMADLKQLKSRVEKILDRFNA